MTYKTILADPPWNTKAGRAFGKYQVKDGRQVHNYNGNKSRDLAYPTMSLAEIGSLNVQALADSDAHLYMWVTNQYLMKAESIINQWGFKYSTTLVWAKNAMGGGLGGNYRITTEFLLFATRGKLKAKDQHIGTWFNEKREYKNGYPCHSKKPIFFTDLIEKVSPGPYLELFAREARPGWHVWGNEVQSDIIL